MSKSIFFISTKVEEVKTSVDELSLILFVDLKKFGPNDRPNDKRRFSGK